ncbi:transposase [bacterium]|nr:transposase [bacterium]MBU1652874.1 transposase [bacterium]MBU1882107.1 transposase [bacterium]
MRLVDAAINQLNVAPLLAQYPGGGRSSYHPLLLKLLIYAYTQPIYSSRRIAKAIRENIHFMRRAGRLSPGKRELLDSETGWTYRSRRPVEVESVFRASCCAV